MAQWRFYGRESVLQTLDTLTAAKQWFFCRIQGRRRIGKTALLRELTQYNKALDGRLIYMQVPNSTPGDVVRQFCNSLGECPSPDVQALAQNTHDFASMACAIEKVCRAGFYVVLDEFQYFTSPQLAAFNSFLQAQVDILRDTPDGGLFVLGSLQADMSALLDNRAAPLYGRLSHSFHLDHWDFEDLLEVFHDHGLTNANQWLTLWTLFEGVPRYYRDAYVQNALTSAEDRSFADTLMMRLFLTEGCPLAEEAEVAFLRELKSQLLSIVNAVANRPGVAHKALIQQLAPDGTLTNSLGAQLKKLIDDYQMIARRQPVFSDSHSRNARYYLTDNFLQAWISVIGPARDAARIQPATRVLEKANARLQTLEGMSFERWVQKLHIECSRKGYGDFELSAIQTGFWNRPREADRLIELDLVALDESNQRARIGSCKRNPMAHDPAALAVFERNIAAFLATAEGKRLKGWSIEKVLFSPQFAEDHAKALQASGYRTLDLPQFARWMR